jgi:hypothetical protein
LNKYRRQKDGGGREMDYILMQFYFSIKIYLISTVIAITMMELVVLIRRFIRLGRRRDA